MVELGDLGKAKKMTKQDDKLIFRLVDSIFIGNFLEILGTFFEGSLFLHK